MISLDGKRETGKLIWTKVTRQVGSISFFDNQVQSHFCNDWPDPCLMNRTVLTDPFRSKHQGQAVLTKGKNKNP